VTHAIDCGDVGAVGDGVGALDGPPRVALFGAGNILFAGMPADGGGIEQHHGAGKSGEPRTLRIPLVPADERGDGP